jgi:hypothetical protein
MGMRFFCLEPLIDADFSAEECVAANCKFKELNKYNSQDTQIALVS